MLVYDSKPAVAEYQVQVEEVALENVRPTPENLEREEQYLRNNGIEVDEDFTIHPVFTL